MKDELNDTKKKIKTLKNQLGHVRSANQAKSLKK